MLVALQRTALVGLDGWDHTELSEVRHGDRSGLIAIRPHDVQLSSLDHDLFRKRRSQDEGRVLMNVRRSGTDEVLEISRADREHVKRVKREKR